MAPCPGFPAKDLLKADKGSRCRQKTLEDHVTCTHPNCGKGKKMPTTFWNAGRQTEDFCLSHCPFDPLYQVAAALSAISHEGAASEGSSAVLSNSESGNLSGPSSPLSPDLMFWSSSTLFSAHL
eukprot:1161058-Pelagomonas_calceolata.AAC.4